MTNPGGGGGGGGVVLFPDNFSQKLVWERDYPKAFSVKAHFIHHPLTTTNLKIKSAGHSSHPPVKLSIICPSNSPRCSSLASYPRHQAHTRNTLRVWAWERGCGCSCSIIVYNIMYLRKSEVRMRAYYYTRSWAMGWGSLVPRPRTRFRLGTRLGMGKIVPRNVM